MNKRSQCPCRYSNLTLPEHVTGVNAVAKFPDMNTWNYNSLSHVHLRGVAHYEAHG